MATVGVKWLTDDSVICNTGTVYGSISRDIPTQWYVQQTVSGPSA